MFKPFPLLSGRHTQTITAFFLAIQRHPPSITRFVHLEDGTKVLMEVTTPLGWDEKTPTVVIVHGFLGSHKSSYSVRLAKKLVRRGVRSIRLNLRGCGNRSEYVSQMCRVESSDAVWQVLKEIKRETPYSSLIVIGFSLGGNIILKMGGERGKDLLNVVNKIIAINPPIDIHASILLVSKNKIYERFFIRALKVEGKYLYKPFKGMLPFKTSKSMSISEFNRAYVIPQMGFSNTEDYYAACSSGHLIPSIRVPSHILCARDDPFVDCSIFDTIQVPNNVDILITEHGGHLGYLGVPGQIGGFHWMYFILFQWIFET